MEAYPLEAPCLFKLHLISVRYSYVLGKPMATKLGPVQLLAIVGPGHSGATKANYYRLDKLSTATLATLLNAHSSMPVDFSLPDLIDAEICLLEPIPVGYHVS